MAGKPNQGSKSDLLLTPSSSRRRMAWKRLQSTGKNRGLTQDQISRYLKDLMRQHYKKVRKEGALTFDKVDRYLEYLAKMAAKTLAQSEIDRQSVSTFSQSIEPVVEDIGTRETLRDDDVKHHASEMTAQATRHVQMLERESGEGAPSEANQMDLAAERQEADDPPEQDQFMNREIVPVGFESQAPQISIRDFLDFPLSDKELSIDPENPFKTHLRYLELAVKQSCFPKEALEQVRQRIPAIEARKYRRYVDLFPDGDFDDARLMMVYSQWRNKVLDRLLVES